MHIEAVLFDLFNTLVLLENDDAFYMPSLKKLHTHLVKNNINVPFEQFLRAYFEVRDQLYEQTGKTLEEPHFNTRISRTLQKLGHNLSTSHSIVTGATQTFCKEFIKYAHPDKDTPHVLNTLHKKHKLAIVSNLAIPECATQILDKYDLTKYFDVVVISGNINKRKPSPAIYMEALKTLKVTPDKAVFIGDTPGTDIKGAKALGLKAILIERPTAPDKSPTLTYKLPETTENVRPDATIKSLRELLNIVKRL